MVDQQESVESLSDVLVEGWGRFGDVEDRELLGEQRLELRIVEGRSAHRSKVSRSRVTARLIRILQALTDRLNISLSSSWL